MIGDILGVQTSTVKNVVYLNERLKVKAPRKRAPPSVAREVLQLGGASLTSLPIQTSFVNGRPASGDQLNSKWVWCEFKNSAHPGRIHLHRWALLSDVVPHQTADTDNDATRECADTPEKCDSKRAGHGVLDADEAILASDSSKDRPDIPTGPSSTADREATSQHGGKRFQKYTCCQYITKGDHPAAQFNKKPQVVRYTPALYQKLLSNLDPSWSSWETDYLFDLCAQLDLRFIIIHDSYRPVEVLQESIAHINSFASSKNASATNSAEPETDSSLPLGNSSSSVQNQPLPRGSKLHPPSIQALYKQKPEQLQLLLERVQAAAPRPVEQLKERYYSITRRIIEHEFNKKIQSVERRFTTLAGSVSSENVEVLTQQKAQLLAEARAEMARHPLIRFQYDIAADKQRREYLDRQYRMSEKERREEQVLFQEVYKGEMNAKRTAKKEEQGAGPGKKRKKGGLFLVPPSLGSRSQTPDSINTFEQIPVTYFQNSILSQRKPGPILASQVMQQFAAPILLQSAAAPGAARGSAGAGGISLSGSSGNTGGAAGHGDSGGTGGHTQPFLGASTAAGSYGQHSNMAANPTTMKKHEERLEAELKALGFGTAGSPLWPTYCDKEIIEAFNTLRVDVVTMINWNTQVEQLEKEKTLWKTRLKQLKEENNRTNSPSTTNFPQRTFGTSGNNTAGDGSYSAHGATTVSSPLQGGEASARASGNAGVAKKVPLRVAPGGDRTVKKSRKAVSKRPSTPGKEPGPN